MTLLQWDFVFAELTSDPPALICMHAVAAGRTCDVIRLCALHIKTNSILSAARWLDVSSETSINTFRGWRQSKDLSHRRHGVTGVRKINWNANTPFKKDVNTF